MTRISYRAKTELITIVLVFGGLKMKMTATPNVEYMKTQKLLKQLQRAVLAYLGHVSAVYIAHGVNQQLLAGQQLQPFFMLRYTMYMKTVLQAYIYTVEPLYMYTLGIW